MSFAPAAGPSRSDEQIRSLVSEELHRDPGIADSAIAVSVEGGVVTLSGTCDSHWTRGEAEAAVRRVDGIRGLANDLEIQSDTTRAGSEIARDAARAIESQTDLPGDTVCVTVTDGVVRLDGQVSSQFQKDVAERSIHKVEGVTRVINDIGVVARASASDVRDRIEKALRRNAEAEARRIRVEVSDSTVHLHGNVRSWTEREEAERAARSTPGASRVENHISIAL